MIKTTKNKTNSILFKQLKDVCLKLNIEKIAKVAIPLIAFISFTATGLIALEFSPVGTLAFGFAGFITGKHLFSALSIILGPYFNSKNYLLDAEAKKLEFDVLLNELPLDHILTKIFPGEKGLNELRQKFKNWARAETVDRLLLFCPLKELENRQIAPSAFVRLVERLGEDLERTQRKYGHELAQLDAKYSLRANNIGNALRYFGSPYKPVGGFLQLAPTSYISAQMTEQIKYKDTLEKCEKRMKAFYESVQEEYQNGFEECFSEIEN